jgi:hypothetical protein
MRTNAPIREIIREWDIAQLRNVLDNDQYGLLYDIDVDNQTNRSVLHAVFERLVDEGGNLIDQNTLSNEEIAKGIEILNYIISKMGNNIKTMINRPDFEGNTPLHYLAEYFDDKGVEFAKILIENGARVDIKNHNYINAEEAAEQNRHYKIRECLIMSIRGNIAPASNAESPRADSLDHHVNNQSR